MCLPESFYVTFTLQTNTNMMVMRKMNEYDLAAAPVPAAAVHHGSPEKKPRGSLGSPEPLPESGWSYHDEDDAFEENLSSLKRDENIIAMS